MIILERIELEETSDAIQAMSQTVLMISYFMNQRIQTAKELHDSEFEMLKCAMKGLEYAINIRKPQMGSEKKGSDVDAAVQPPSGSKCEDTSNDRK